MPKKKNILKCRKSYLYKSHKKQGILNSSQNIIYDHSMQTKHGLMQMVKWINVFRPNKGLFQDPRFNFDKSNNLTADHQTVTHSVCLKRSQTRQSV